MDLFSPSENPLTESGAATPSGSERTPPPPEPRMEAARLIAYRIANGQRISRAKLHEVMTASYGGSDAEGVWTWKDAYDAAEARHLLKVAKALIAADPATVLERLGSLAALQPPNRHRTEESLALQQFSTPAPYAYAAFLAAEPRENDVLLEPSAGHGALAVFGRIAPLLEACGFDGAPVRLTATDALAALHRAKRVPLSEGAFIAPCRMMDRQRIEVRDAPASWLPGLKARGCFTEIIQWRTRVFAPVGDAQVLDRVIDRFGPGLASEAA